MKIRWIAITLFVSTAYALGCGSDGSGGSASGCAAVCNCVVRALGETARADCNTQCATVIKSADPVQACEDRLAANSVTSCDATCSAFDSTSGGTGGSSSTGGSGPGASGGEDGNGGSSPASGGSGPGAGGVTSPGGAGGSGPVPAAARIGRACVKDTDCGTGLTCLTTAGNTFIDGGPANGYCSADCASGPEACQALDPNTVCVQFTDDTGAGPSFCLEACVVGDSSAGKCHARQDLACDDTSGSAPGDGFCRPVCRGDADCGARQCDLGSGLCVDAGPRGTLPIGSPCSLAATTDPCAGICTALTNDMAGPGVCSGICTLGAPGCGIDPAATDAQPAACLFPLTVAEPASGDLGFCGQLCDCDDECTAEGLVCRPLPAAEATAAGFKGYCGSAMTAAGATAEHLACQ